MCNTGSRLKIDEIIHEKRKAKHLKTTEISQGHEMIILRVVKSRGTRGTGQDFEH